MHKADEQTSFLHSMESKHPSSHPWRNFTLLVTFGCRASGDDPEGLELKSQICICLDEMLGWTLTR